MSRINIANFKKTVYYLKRNGLRDTYLAALERFRADATPAEPYEPLSKKDECRQREKKWAEDFSCKFSIIVPTYKTPAEFLTAMVDSVLEQTYPDFELILADASPDDSVKTALEKYEDKRIVYLALKENGGISDNTNQGLWAATGDYIGLLDHDDVLTKDALYEMACAIEKAGLEKRSVAILYSDEDKCDETGTLFYEPHRKTDFNPDLILSNNYICHFLVMKSSLMKKVGFRREYDGAQDFDLVLRGIAELMETSCGADERAKQTAWREQVVHIPKILYHWRCHSGSTAVNPRSKMYAYEAGGRAIRSFLERTNRKAEVEPLKHLGFYRVNYLPDLLAQRPEVGVVGGSIYGKGKKIEAAVYEKDGTEPYKGLRKGFSGYMNRGALVQEVFAADVRNVKVRKELRELYEEVTGLTCRESGTAFVTDRGKRQEEKDWKEVSLRFAEEVRRRGYTILWDPEQ